MGTGYSKEISLNEINVKTDVSDKNWSMVNKGLESVSFWLMCCVSVVGSSPIKGPSCFLEQETVPLLLSCGCFKERIPAWFHNQTKLNWRPYWRLN